MFQTRNTLFVLYTILEKIRCEFNAIVVIFGAQHCILTIVDILFRRNGGEGKDTYTD